MIFRSLIIKNWFFNPLGKRVSLCSNWNQNNKFQHVRVGCDALSEWSQFELFRHLDLNNALSELSVTLRDSVARTYCVGKKFVIVIDIWVSDSRVLESEVPNLVALPVLIAHWICFPVEDQKAIHPRWVVECAEGRSHQSSKNLLSLRNNQLKRAVNLKLTGDHFHHIPYIDNVRRSLVRSLD